MLPHSFRDLFSYFKGPLGTQFEYLSHSGYRQPSGEFSPFSSLHAFLDICGKSPPPQAISIFIGSTFQSNDTSVSRHELRLILIMAIWKRDSRRDTKMVYNLSPLSRETTMIWVLVSLLIKDKN